MEFAVLNQPDGDVIARGSYYGGPEFEFVVAADGQVFFRMVGDTDGVWAGPDADSFRRIAAAWHQCRADVRSLGIDAAKIDRIRKLRTELMQLGALPDDLPPDPEPLCSLLLFEAENGLG